LIGSSSLSNIAPCIGKFWREDDFSHKMPKNSKNSDNWRKMERWRYILMDFAGRCWLGRRGPGKGIAVVSSGHLGDILHAVPMLKAIRAQNPQKQLFWLVGPWSEPLARRYAHYVDKIIIFGPNLPPLTRGKAVWRQHAFKQWQMALKLRKNGIETLIAPLNGFGRFLANAIQPNRWIGIGERRPPRVRRGIQTVVQPYEKDRYEADALCGLLKPLGIEVRADRLEYVVTPEERQAASEFLRMEAVDLTRPLALFAPGSGWSGKNWLPERFGAVAEWLAAAKGFQIAWVGTPNEVALVPASRSGDWNWVGKTSLSLLAGIMARAQLFVGNDSGLLHFAAALDVPSVSIWGPTSPGKWGPKGDLHRTIRKAERCADCIYWDYRETCRHDHACMKAVGVADVQKAINSLIGEPLST
jgi:ADP-heptose:LPS heptosyltransferase